MGLLNNEEVQAVLKNRKHLFEQKDYNPRDSFREQPKLCSGESKERQGLQRQKLQNVIISCRWRILAGLTGIGKFWYANEEGKCWKE